jgi:hypothetical protein
MNRKNNRFRRVVPESGESMKMFRVLLTAACLVAAFAADAAAQSDPFFKGKQIKIALPPAASSISGRASTHSTWASTSPAIPI